MGGWGGCILAPYCPLETVLCDGGGSDGHMVCSSFRQQKLEKVMDQEGLADEEVSVPSQQQRNS